MIDLDRAHAIVRASVSRWLRECVWCDTTAIDRGEAGIDPHMTPIEDLAACWAEWAAAHDHDVPVAGIPDGAFRALVRAELEMRATKADCVYDHGRGRSTLRVNMVVRGDGTGVRRDASHAVRLVDSDFVDTSEAEMVPCKPGKCRGCA